MRLVLCRLCQIADRLASSGNPVLIGLFSRMVSETFPAWLDPCFLALEIETDPVEQGRETPLGVRLIDQDGHTLATWHVVLQLFESNGPFAHRTFFTIPLPFSQDVQFNRPGVYRFDVLSHPDEENETVLGGETLTVETVDEMRGSLEE